MNIQTEKMKNQRKPIKEHSVWRIYCGVILKLIMLLLAIFAVANSYIYLNQQIQMIERDNTAVTRKIEDIDRELKNLQNRYEAASSRTMIDRQITRFNLKLREPDYSQIKRISLADPYKQYAPEQADKNSSQKDDSRQIADIDRPSGHR
ncbi:MAG: hypothetical protein IKB71_02525 [Lentisphaeria bacterium]|nr:hypothetical protein [Lentisphaeria bacterium]